MALKKLREFITECGRVLRVAKKPSKQEYWTIAKVSGIGILVIGLMGFLLHLIDRLTSVVIVSVLVAVIVLILLFMKGKNN
ncbi:MAG: protein translocase SEC61 complex subunit gamma [Candidatus Woesearchaeota archaeon]|jgi:protein transport protein SEC61 subunit gamma-like protein